ncbi:Zinc finger CCHC domain-containing protein 24 [Mucor circinelloides]
MTHFKDIAHSKAPFSVRIVEFGCPKCSRRWSSANGSLEDYQKCKNCYTECYPVGSRIRKPNKFGNENRQTYQGHNKELCGKCTRLGRSCMTLGNESDDDVDEINMYMNTREHCHDGNQPVIESYSPKEWPELATVALRYLPKPQEKSHSDRIRLSTTSNDMTSVGMTAAETLTNMIHNAREETSNELPDDFSIHEDHSEDSHEDNHHDATAVTEIWHYESFNFDEGEDENYGEMYYNNISNRLDGELLMNDDDSDEKEPKEEEPLAFDNDTDSESYFYRDDQSYFSNQDDKAYFGGIDGMSSDDGPYKKQMNNRLLRRGRKHILQGRKNSLKLIVD